jgi:hypothetical protein
VAFKGESIANMVYLSRLVARRVPNQAIKNVMFSDGYKTEILGRMVQIVKLFNS